MGSNVAPPYACSFMHDFEQKHIFFNDLFREHCATWWRYIDDIFAIWRGNIESLKTFDEMINSISPNIQFKIHIGGDSVPFLDIRAYIKQGWIETDIYIRNPQIGTSYYDMIVTIPPTSLVLSLEANSSE